MRKILDNEVFKMLYSIVKFIIFTVLFIYVLFLVTQRVIKTSVFGYRIYTVSSESMKPVYKKGDVILVEDATYDELKVGDIITYKGKGGEVNGLTITHRIVQMNDEEETITTKGDVNNNNDPVINKDQVLGKAKYKFKTLSFASKILNNKVAFFLLFIIPLGIVLALDVYDFIYELKHPEEEIENGE